MRGTVIPILLIAALLAFPAAIAAAAGAEPSAHDPKRKKARAAERPFGREGDPRKVKRVIAIDMSDAMRYFPSEVRVKRGETVRFTLRNSGHLPHEMVIGTMDELRKHAALMKKQHHMDHAEHADHAEPHAAHVAPGARSKLVWQFTKAGEFHYACLVPGHFEAGMIGTIVVR